MPELVRWCVDSVGLGPSTGRHPVLHFFQDNGAVPNDGVGIQLDEQVRGPNTQQLRGCYRPRRFYRGDKKQTIDKTKPGKPTKRRALYTGSRHSLVSKDSKPQKQIQTDISEEELKRISADGSEWCITGICSMLYFPFKNLRPQNPV